MITSIFVGISILYICVAVAVFLLTYMSLLIEICEETCSDKEATILDILTEKYPVMTAICASQQRFAIAASAFWGFFLLWDLRETWDFFKIERMRERLSNQENFPDSKVD